MPKDKVAAKVKFIEATLAKIERELEEAPGPEKEIVRKLIARAYLGLRAMGRQTVH